MGTYYVENHIANLKHWVGFHEGFDNANPFSLWMGYGTSHLPWCGAFANYCAVTAGFRWPSYCQFNYKGDGYVPLSEQHAKEMGLWRDKHSHAKPGWQVIYDWTFDGVADHIETVLQDSDNQNTLVTIGGNTGDAVQYKLRDRTYIRGFIALDEAGQNADASIPPPTQEQDTEEDEVMLIHDRHHTTDPFRPKTAQLIKSANRVFLWGGAKVSGGQFDGTPIKTSVFAKTVDGVEIRTFLVPTSAKAGLVGFYSMPDAQGFYVQDADDHAFKYYWTK
jgi:hypothetical protein